MTGKELKAFASQVPDEAEVSVRERNYGAWEPRFEIQASMVFSSHAAKEKEMTDV